jgi:hypothetical protein
MITDADINKMKKVFATKDDLKKFVTKDESKKFATKEDLLNVSTELIRSFRSELSGLKEDIINFKDSILTEIIELREDVAVVTGYRNLIEDHDKRIEKLETVVYH